MVREVSKFYIIRIHNWFDPNVEEGKADKDSSRPLLSVFLLYYVLVLLAVRVVIGLFLSHKFVMSI